MHRSGLPTAPSFAIFALEKVVNMILHFQRKLSSLFCWLLGSVESVLKTRIPTTVNNSSHRHNSSTRNCSSPLMMTKNHLYSLPILKLLLLSILRFCNLLMDGSPHPLIQTPHLLVWKKLPKLKLETRCLNQDNHLKRPSISGQPFG